MNKVIPVEQDISEISPHEYPNSTIKDIDYAQHKYCTVNDAEYCYLEYSR